MNEKEKLVVDGIEKEINYQIDETISDREKNKAKKKAKYLIKKKVFHCPNCRNISVNISAQGNTPRGPRIRIIVHCEHIEERVIINPNALHL